MGAAIPVDAAKSTTNKELPEPDVRERSGAAGERNPHEARRRQAWHLHASDCRADPYLRADAAGAATWVSDTSTTRSNLP